MLADLPVLTDLSILQIYPALLGSSASFCCQVCQLLLADLPVLADLPSFARADLHSSCRSASICCQNWQIIQLCWADLPVYCQICCPSGSASKCWQICHFSRSADLPAFLAALLVFLVDLLPSRSRPNLAQRARFDLLGGGFNLISRQRREARPFCRKAAILLKNCGKSCFFSVNFTKFTGGEPVARTSRDAARE